MSMSIQTLLILIFVGITAGVVAGSLGVGGGIIIVPALVYIFHFSQHQAQGTSLGVLLFPIGLLAVINYHKQGFINYRFVLILVITFVLGGYLGSLISINLPEKTLRKVFGILMLIAGLKMVFEK